MLEIATKPSCKCRATHLVSEPHNSPRWSHRDETARDKSLDPSLLRGFGQGDLILLLRGTDAANHDVDAGKRLAERILRAFQVASADFDSSLLQLLGGRLDNRPGTYKGGNLLS